MLNYAITFFILAIIAAVLGFGGIAGTLAGGAELLFYGFIILFVISVLANLLTGKRTNTPL